MCAHLIDRIHQQNCLPLSAAVWPFPATLQLASAVLGHEQRRRAHRVSIALHFSTQSAHELTFDLLRSGSAFGDAADAALKMKLHPRFSPYRESDYDLLFLHGVSARLWLSGAVLGSSAASPSVQMPKQSIYLAVEPAVCCFISSAKVRAHTPALSLTKRDHCCFAPGAFIFEDVGVTAYKVQGLCSLSAPLCHCFGSTAPICFACLLLRAGHSMTR
jgi:hypothetical protein